MVNHPQEVYSLSFTLFLEVSCLYAEWPGPPLYWQQNITYYIGQGDLILDIDTNSYEDSVSAYTGLRCGSYLTRFDLNQTASVITEQIIT